MAKSKLKRALVAPLDWGMGHTARCVPIIRYLIESHVHVVFAGNKNQQAYISSRFPQLELVDLDGYDIVYGTSKLGNKLTIAAQLTQLGKKIKTEHEWLKKNVTTIQPDLIISDNRYGLYASDINSVILTHQLQIMTGVGALGDMVVQKYHYSLLNKFSEVWVPDVATAPGLAGKLAHPGSLPSNMKYIGLLSRYADQPVTNEGNFTLALLSGPEPQRSIFEQELREQFKAGGKHITIVGGTWSKDAALPEEGGITYYSQPDETTLFDLIAKAKVVISRSGYSTLMDLVAMGKKAIVVPTPGQTEQEYLAKSLAENGTFMAGEQGKSNFPSLVERSQNFVPKFPFSNADFMGFKSVVDEAIGGV